MCVDGDGLDGGFVSSVCVGGGGGGGGSSCELSDDNRCAGEDDEEPLVSEAEVSFDDSDCFSDAGFDWSASAGAEED